MELWHIVVLILLMPLAFAATVIIHEYGHWLGGVYAGYRTVYICLFSFVFYKDTSGKHKNARYHGMTGQCIMVPRNGKESKPDTFISGGPIMNLAAGIVAMVVVWVMIAEMMTLPAVLVGMFAMFSFTLGIMNFIPRGTNDGANLREIKKSDANRKAYNKVMEVYAHNVLGVTFMEMPEELLGIPKGAEGSLADELEEYSEIREECIRYMLLSEPESGKMEVSGEPDMKMGAWELWKECWNDDPKHTGAYLAVCREHIRKKEIDLGEWRTSEKLMMKRMELNGFGKGT